MAFKDTINKMVSYFDTDEVSEVEEEKSSPQPERAQKPQQVDKPNQSQQINRPLGQKRPSSSQEHHVPNYQGQQRNKSVDHLERKAVQEERTSTTRRDQFQYTTQQGQTTIALKYPKKYEDAQEIVDLLIENECVLIDFQFMLDAQARRCIDFIDGASKVLYGKLQKVGSSMYLLTPSNVSVDIEEMTVPNSNQEFGFDFDMKRR
ncbi:cell division protein SepF [Streptococcus catagoni]|uniref:cell division protein SepF n=1 Tax=Streptococcus catagoni TaxID=2654874 RepID=UPI001409BEA6|nr:cell division protein SepF [Streptococcus catagoni]